MIGPRECASKHLLVVIPQEKSLITCQNGQLNFFHNTATVLLTSIMLLSLQKARARLRVLNQSRTLDDATKQKIRPILKAEFMSSEESVTEEIQTDRDHSSGSDVEEVHPSRQRKTLIKHKLPW